MEERTLPLINGQHGRETLVKIAESGMPDASTLENEKSGGTSKMSLRIRLCARIRRIFFSLPGRAQILQCCFLRSFDNTGAVGKYEERYLQLLCRAVRRVPNMARPLL